MKDIDKSNESRDVPYIVFEGEQARNERTIKKLVIALIIAVALIFASNVVWLYFWNQYDYEAYNLYADGKGNANYIGNDGDIYNNGGTD